MRRNNQTNRLIKWIVTFGDFLILNAIIAAVIHWHQRVVLGDDSQKDVFFLANNLALLIAQIRFSTIIHLRMVDAGDILRRTFELAVTYAVITFVIVNLLLYSIPLGRLLLEIFGGFAPLLVLKRFAERRVIRLYREAGGNTRSVVLVGSDHALEEVYHKLINDPTLGYIVLGCYGEDVPDGIDKLGSLEDFVRLLDSPDNLMLGDELYLCVSRQESTLVRKVSQMCDHHLIRFYYVPLSVESLGVELKREMLDDIEVYTTIENPLQNSINRMIKRIFDILLSIVFLIPTILIFPIIWIIVKIQSPGPIFFRQERTGIDGKSFICLKFRSMHKNKESDALQATKNDPRTFPFGRLMRQLSIDELPQFWNVLKGDMSIVGPRPHMLVHTAIYSQLIDRYMVRHFVKPGITGWAQVTGYRGETKELWQMEGRVKRDIWYMEHWSIWLDIHIIWMTVKLLFKHEDDAY